MKRSWSSHDHAAYLRILPTLYSGHHVTTYQTVQPFIIKFYYYSKFLLTSCDLVRTVSHDRGLGYSNRFDSAEFVHVTHTWSSSFAQNPRNLYHRILGTSPVSSEIDIPNETDIPRVSLTASPTHLSWVAQCHHD